MGFVTIYDDPEERPPEFNCMSAAISHTDARAYATPNPTP